jgi:hypothetical protein
MKGVLGFGCSHLPLISQGDSTSIDEVELARMVDLYLANGLSYFDVAYTYHDGACEEAIHRTLVRRHLRENFQLADKLPTLLIESEAHQEQLFESQLMRCGVTYFDRYMVHCATHLFFERAEQFRSFEFALRQKQLGRVRQVGFSFHDTPELLDRILTTYPEVDFVQLQINYLDWNQTPIQSQRCYEVARRHGKSIVAMCSLKGGTLATLPGDVERAMHALHPDWSATTWALRFVAELEGVDIVLSGMNTREQMKTNIESMQIESPLGEEEHRLLERVAVAIRREMPIQCTGCGYCLPVCPQQIPIAEYMSLYNEEMRTAHRMTDILVASYKQQGHTHAKASACIDCKRCEGRCPQHLSIAEWMQQIASVFEYAPTARLVRG